MITGSPAASMNCFGMEEFILEPEPPATIRSDFSAIKIRRKRF
jgi:hypothetical protein